MSAGALSAEGARRKAGHGSGLRILLVGGLLSYRALFGWLSPWVLVPTLLV